ncbi:MAG TPA: alpha/beta hydrolase domain-containing protein [Planctomycetaceae bacterium]|nr:alpha/beta hydrolase domain-containing protein [Planctomycetaceae bacterium]
MSRCAAVLFVGLSFFGSVAAAAVTRFEIANRTEVADGQPFGDVGPYERITGRVYYRVDPSTPANRAIVDLSLAPRTADGLVEFWAELDVLTPKDATKSNGAILYDVNNRGNKLALRMFNDGGGNDPKTAADFGHGFLMRHGFTVVWSGWDGELLPGGDRLRLAAPRVVSDAGPITGLVRCEVIADAPTTRMVVNWANHGSYRPTDRGIAEATLTVRERPSDERVPVPRDQWTLHVSEVSSDLPTQLPKVEIELPTGLKPGWIYEIIYEAQDPLVMGAGFVAVRDLMSAFKHGTGDAHPLLCDGQPYLTRAHGFGVSQSGRFLREYLYWGCNADEQGRKVFDGVIPHVAGGGLGSFNHRFAQPTRHSNQHDHHDYPPDRFPFAYEDQIDPLSGEHDGILRRCRALDVTPVVLHTQSSAEYWTRAGSLPHTDPLGTRDAMSPDNVRFYTFGGTQHGPSGYPPQKGNGQTLANPGDYRPFLRALLLALDRHCRDGVALPPSMVPRIADHTLVDWRQSATGFPNIPGGRYPEIIHEPLWLYRGPRWHTERIIDVQPPQVLGHYRVLAPKCDADGNDLGCLLPPEVAVPVATYTGWNLRRPDVGAANELVSLTGSYIPFPVTDADQKSSGDPRRSVQSRYGTHAEYVARFTAECQRLQAAGFLLSEDAERLPKVHAERARMLFP